MSLAVGFGLVVLVPVLLTTPVRQDLGWIDSVSGSRKSQVAWLRGWSTTPVVTESPLAARFRQLGLTWEPDWRKVALDAAFDKVLNARSK